MIYPVLEDTHCNYTTRLLTVARTLENFCKHKLLVASSLFCIDRICFIWLLAMMCPMGDFRGFFFLMTISMIIFISAFEEMVMYITVYCIIFPTLIYSEIEKVTKTTLNFRQILNLKWL